MSDNLDIKDKIINDALKNVNFDGWNKETILTGFISNKTWSRNLYQIIIHQPR